MSIIKGYIKSYLPFVTNEIKGNMQYRLPFFISLLSRGFTVLVTYYLWRAIYNSSPNDMLGGFNFMEMTSYVIVSFFTTTMISSVGTNQIAYEITDGSIAMNLIKPISYRTYIFSMSLGNLFTNSFIMGFPFLLLFTILGWIQMPLVGGFMFYLISIILSFTVMFFFGFCFAMLAFYTTYFFGLNMAKEVAIKFFSGSMIPLTFFPDSVENIFRFLPFASMNYTPVMIYLGKISGSDIYYAMGLQVIWIVVLYLLSNLLWNHAIKRLTILGG